MSAPDRSAPHAVRPARPKRVKIDVACNACRAKKIKCDGVRPTCGNCSKKLVLRNRCTYCQDGGLAPAKRSAPVDIQRMDSHSVTQEPGRRESSTYGSSRNMDYARLPRATTQNMHRMTGNSPASNTSPAGSYGAGHSTGEYSTGSRAIVVASNTSPSVIDSMTAVADEGTRPREYFGSSSAGSFTAQIRKAIDARLGNPSTIQSGHVAAQRTAFTAPATPGVISDANRVLPTRRQADQLLDLYWKYVDPLYPFLDRPKWEESYRGIFNGSAIELDEQTFLATLNVIFALSSQLLESQTPEQRDDSSNVYSQRAQHLLPLNTWDPGSVELVQYLLLTSQYLQSTESPHQTWMTVSSAIRIAQGLGLHLCETSADQPQHREREMLRRVWYGCVLMDRMVSVTHGRPSMISSNLATLVPLPTYSRHSSTDKGNMLTDASFFVKSVELYDILHRAVTTLYDISGARSKNVMASEREHTSSDDNTIDLGAVIQLDSALVKWEKALPERLNASSSDLRDEITHRQAVILHMRLLHARSLLFRPMLASFCLAQRTDCARDLDTLEARVLQQCAELCVSTAQEIISVLLDHQTDGTVGVLPAWWYRVYYVYTAATILIATKLCPEVFPGASISRAWSQAMSVLKAHEKFGQSVRRCLAALHFLAARIVQDSAGGSEAVRRNAGTSRQHTPPEQNHNDICMPQFADEFSLSVGDLGEVGIQEVDFDVNNLSWLNDMHGTWELLNHG